MRTLPTAARPYPTPISGRLLNLSPKNPEASFVILAAPSASRPDVRQYAQDRQACGRRAQAGERRPLRKDARRTTRVSPSWSLVERAKRRGRISAKRLLPAAGAAGYEGRTTTSAVWSPRRRPSGGVSITAAGTPGCLWVRQAARAASCGTWLLRLSSVIMTRHMWSASRRLRQRLASRGVLPSARSGNAPSLAGRASGGSGKSVRRGRRDGVDQIGVGTHSPRFTTAAVDPSPTSTAPPDHPPHEADRFRRQA